MRTIGSIVYIVLNSISVLLKVIPIFCLIPGDAVGWLAKKILEKTR